MPFSTLSAGVLRFCVNSPDAILSSSDFAFAAAAVESAPEVSAPKATPRKALRRDDGDASAASEMVE